MIYIISDIHGQYRRYQKVLEKINFSDDDQLYVLGDVIDRGPGSFEILLDIMDRDNVELFLGNHEHMMLTYLDNIDTKTWFYEANGGKNTYDQFLKLDKDVQKRIVDYLKNNTTVVKNLNINNHKYILSHTSALVEGVDIYTKKFKNELMTLQDVVWNQYPYDVDYLSELDKIDEEIILISGHIITRRLHDSDEIYIRDYQNGYIWIDIDCGCALGDDLGQLACLSIGNDGIIDYILYVK